LRQFIKSKYGALMDKLEQTKDMDAEGEKAWSAAIEDFKKNGTF
jgi:F-type H+-transporting ATPase subunit alpha